MGLGGLFIFFLYKKGWVEWVTSMTYQAASGAGAANMRELVAQMTAVGQVRAAAYSACLCVCVCVSVCIHIYVYIYCIQYEQHARTRR